MSTTIVDNKQLVNQPNWRPTRKVAAGAALGLPVATLIAWGISAFTGIPITPEVAAAIGSLFTAITSYAVRDNS